MIFKRALLREFTQLAAAVFMTLFLIALTTRLIRLLGLAAGGKLPSESVVALMGFFALHSLPTLLSLTLFITILLTLSRWYRDSEMVIWFSSGQSLAAWIPPVLTFAAPLVLVIGAMSMVGAPWAFRASQEYESKVDTRDDVARVEPGVFGESRTKSRVFFVESVAGDASTVQNVFVNTRQLTRDGVMVAKQGYTRVAANGDRFLVLVNGHRYEGTPGEAEYRVMEFEKYEVRIEAREGDEPPDTVRGRNLLALLEDRLPQNMGELFWRVSQPVAALLLALLAIPLSFVNPRAGRSVNLLFALLAFFTYSNLLTLTQSRIAQGRVPFSVGIWVVHAAMLAIFVILFAQRLAPLRMRLRLWR